MTRLLQAMAGARHGGAEGFFARLAVALGTSGVTQRLAIRQDQDRACLLRDHGLDIVELPFGGWFDRQTRPALRRLVKEWRPDLVLTWMNRATSLMPAGASPVVARLGGYYDLKYYRRADHLIGNTEAIVRYVVDQGWPPARAHYLPNFVDGGRRPPVDRASLGIPEGVPVALALGRLHRNKGFDVLLEAVVGLPRLHLLVAGDGPERIALERQLARLGLQERARLLGWRDDTAALMATADVVVVPSRHEPLGNVVIEAWAQGVPIVAAAASGPASLIRSGENGWLVPIEDADALAAAIRTVLAGPRAAVIEAGYADYQLHYSEAVVVAAYRDLFRRIAV